MNSTTTEQAHTGNQKFTKNKVYRSVEKHQVFSENKVDKIVVDCCVNDADDPLMASEYVDEIFDHLRVLEVSTMPDPAYMNYQDDLEWCMRVNILDRFLSVNEVDTNNLQLAGLASILIAAKYEEIRSNHIIVNFLRNGFSVPRILRAERYILSALNYDLSYPSPMNFLRRILKAGDFDLMTRTASLYFVQISLLDHRFISYRPSQIAAASAYLARKIFGNGVWDATVAQYAGYSEQQIKQVFLLMVDYLARPVAHRNFYSHYAKAEFMRVSIDSRTWSKENAKEL
ncbi:hypothetical protein VE03_10394, partial [Pseudogymnoascus sp. 23342-1-I1]